MILKYKNENGKLIELTLNKNVIKDWFIYKDYIHIMFEKEMFVRKKENIYKWSFSINVMKLENFKEVKDFLEKKTK